MEKKKSIKISLSTFFLIIALIVIIIMAYYIYVQQTNSAKMQNTINDLQEKVNSISSTISSNTNGEVNNSQTKFSNKEIKESISNYLNIFVGYGSIEGILEDLDLLEMGEYQNSELTSDNYRKTNIKYSDFKSTVMNYMTEEWFNTINTRYDSQAKFKEINGLLYYQDVGLTGSSYVVENITVKGDYSDLNYIVNGYFVNPDDSKEQDNREFHIANYNRKCVISYCD